MISFLVTIDMYERMSAITRGVSHLPEKGKSKAKKPNLIEREIFENSRNFDHS